MAALPKRKILYFTEDMVPTPADIAAVEALGAGTVIRNATFVDENPFEGQIEKCDAVAGHAPKPYRDRFKYVGDEPAKAESVTTENETPPAPPAPEASTEPAAPAAPEVPPAPPAPVIPQPASDGWAQTPPAPPVA